MSGRLDKVFAGIERVGNKIPDPFMLFVYLIAILAVASTIVAAFHVTVTIPGQDEAQPVRGILTSDGIVWWLENFVDNFISFPPLGNVLVMLIAVGVAERTGFLSSAVTATFARAPRWLLPYAVAFVACQGHVMSDPSVIVIPPLAALVFKAAGRHPIAGLIGAFACGTAGYGGGILIGSLDALLQGITQEVVGIVPQGAQITTHIAMNYFFSAVAGLILPVVGGFLIDKVLEPRLGPWTDPDKEPQRGLDSRQRRALIGTVVILAVYVVGVFAAWLLPGSPLRGEGGALIPSPFVSGIVPLIVVAFLIAGVSYGLFARTITSTRDVPKMMAEAVKDMSGYIVFIFAAAQFIALFTWTNLGTLLAVKAAEGLEAAHLTGYVGVLCIVLIATFANLFITSGSALWALLAPVMVPAFMLLGYDPAFIQAAYRIGDSATQPITPLNPYVYVQLEYARRYQPELQLGGLLARLSIFVIPFWITWVAVLTIFYVFGLPVGPGSEIRLPGQ
ncbi:AbgT family transporter [Tenggerimyces flavus]|uniref:AbgT family transporter n=1 Tax=Tenggerimyces flavus TaxID=1708749 RepID=A0ABV7YEK7_9ACTN|nr:AbgT family transporter [Tenggerimyces flavus]MBM7785993.1 aminobenzoyl-glutamate transport protein [Tenggerimyces flavus]